MIQSLLTIQCGSMYPTMQRTLFNVSFDYLKLPLGLLEKDRFKRIGLEEVLGHPWICKRSKEIAEIRKNVDLIE